MKMRVCRKCGRKVDGRPVCRSCERQVEHEKAEEGRQEARNLWRQVMSAARR